MSQKYKGSRLKLRRNKTAAGQLIHDFNVFIVKSTDSNQDWCLEQTNAWVQKLQQSPEHSSEVLDQVVGKLFHLTEGRDSMFTLLGHVFCILAKAFPEEMKDTTRLAFFRRVFNLRDKSDDDLPEASKNFRIRRCCRFAAKTCGWGHVEPGFLNSMLMCVTYTETKAYTVNVLRQTLISRVDQATTALLDEHIVELILEFTLEKCQSAKGVAGVLEGLLETRFLFPEAKMDHSFFSDCLKLYFDGQKPNTFSMVHTYPLWEMIQRQDFDAVQTTEDTSRDYYRGRQ